MDINNLKNVIETKANPILNDLMFARSVAMNKVSANKKGHFSKLSDKAKVEFMKKQQAKIRKNWDLLSPDLIKNNFNDDDYSLDEHLKYKCTNYWIYMTWNFFTSSYITNKDITNVCAKYNIPKAVLGEYYQHVVDYHAYDSDYRYYRLSRAQGHPAFSKDKINRINKKVRGI